MFYFVIESTQDIYCHQNIVILILSRNEAACESLINCVMIVKSE